MIREHAPTCTVAAVATLFGVLLCGVAEVVFRLVLSDPSLGETASFMSFVAMVCIVIVAGLTSCIVVMTTVQHVVEEQRAIIALRRLLGASASQERRRTLTASLAAGSAGVVIGAIAGTFAQVLLTMFAQTVLSLPVAVQWISVGSVVPVLVVALSTVVAVALGTRATGAVSPLEAIRSAAAQSPRPPRKIGSWVVLSLGLVLVVGAAAAGGVTWASLPVAVVGGIVTSFGVLGVGPVVLPRIVHAVGGVLGRGVPATTARRNAKDARDRTSGLVLALAVGIATVTMMIVSGQTAKAGIESITGSDPRDIAEAVDMLTSIVSVIALLVGCSALVAVLGFATSMATAVRQRTRELGLLRALGMSVGQLRSMVAAETIAVCIVALCLGLALGIGFGWLGAWTTLGTTSGLGPMVVIVPWQFLLALVTVTALIAAIAATPATLKVRRLSPSVALAAA